MKVTVSGHKITYPVGSDRHGYVIAPERKASQPFEFDGKTVRFPAPLALPKHVRDRCLAVAREHRKGSL